MARRRSQTPPAAPFAVDALIVAHAGPYAGHPLAFRLVFNAPFGVVLVLVMSAGAFAAIYYILVDTFGEHKVKKYLEGTKASSRSLVSSVSKSARGLQLKAAK